MRSFYIAFLKAFTCIAYSYLYFVRFYPRFKGNKNIYEIINFIVLTIAYVGFVITMIYVEV